MEFPAIRRARPSVAAVILAVMFLAIPLTSAVAGSGTVKVRPDARPDERPLREFIYYPNYAQSAYNYQSTGDFAAVPMVLPPSVPIIQQPAALIVQAPPLGSGAPPGGGVRAAAPPPPPTMAAVSAPAMVGGGMIQAGKSYSLHVGSSIDSSHADLLLRQVGSAGIPAYRRPMAYKDLTWEQIHAGPFDSYEKASQVAKQLQKKFQIQGRIVSH
ncbi:MAG: hypothetical protein HQL73_05640 [Magnetococcales bacterium]|nr:hypothetical protein [Magnetococcales bacterium]